MTIEFPKYFIRTKVRVQVAELVRDLGPVVGHEIIQFTGKQRAVVSKVLYDLRDAGLIYIQSWDHPGDSNCIAPVWAWRTDPKQRDAKRPKPLTSTEINIRWNARHSARRSAAQRAKRGTTISVWAGLL